MALTLWVAVRHEQEHRRDIVYEVEIISLGSATLAVLVWAFVRNIRDARRAKSLRAEIVSIKDEHNTQIIGQAKQYEQKTDGLRKSIETLNAQLVEDKKRADENFRKWNDEVQAHKETKTREHDANIYKARVEAQLAECKKATEALDPVSQQFDKIRSAVIPASPKTLTIKSAQFGLEGSRLDDVTLRVQAEIRNNTLDIPVSDEVFPDPFGVRMVSAVVTNGRNFFLRVIYDFGDRVDQVAVRRLGDRLVLPEPHVSSAEAL
jgi:hypothetical protein